MSDDEELIYKKPQNLIHYGSLEDAERARQTLEDIQSDDEEDDYEPDAKKPNLTTTNGSSSTALVSATQAGNINVSNEYFDLEQEMYV